MDIEIIKIASNTENNKIVKNHTHYSKNKNPICGDVMLISLIIKDLHGRKIKELLKGNKKAGYHKVNWDAYNIASGIYFVKLISDDFIDQHKLMLIK